MQSQSNPQPLEDHLLSAAGTRFLCHVRDASLVDVSVEIVPALPDVPDVFALAGCVRRLLLFSRHSSRHLRPIPCSSTYKTPRRNALLPKTEGSKSCELTNTCFKEAAIREEMKSMLKLQPE